MRIHLPKRKFEIFQAGDLTAVKYITLIALSTE